MADKIISVGEIFEKAGMSYSIVADYLGKGENYCPSKSEIQGWIDSAAMKVKILNPDDYTDEQLVKEVDIQGPIGLSWSQFNLGFTGLSQGNTIQFYTQCGDGDQLNYFYDNNMAAGTLNVTTQGSSQCQYLDDPLILYITANLSRNCVMTFEVPSFYSSATSSIPLIANNWDFLPGGVTYDEYTGFRVASGNYITGVTSKCTLQASGYSQTFEFQIQWNINRQ